MKRRALFDDERETTVLGLMRVALGVLLVVQSGQRLAEIQRVGYFGDAFHMPLVPPEWVPSETGYVALLVLSIVGGLAAVVGRWGREGLLVASSTGVFLIACNRLDYHNNRFALFLVAFLAAFTRCDRSFVLGRANAGASARAPFFAVFLIRIQVALVYLSSAGGKLLDSDWRGGQTMLIRFSRSIDALTIQGFDVPPWVAELYRSPLFASVASKAAITTELFVAGALFIPKLRALALYVGVLFHIGIELSARVELFSYVMGAAYVAFVVPETRERVLRLDLASPRGARVAAVVRRLDWLSRLRIEAGPELALTDRSGGTATGALAVAGLARALPLFFPLWVPLRLLALLRGRAG